MTNKHTELPWAYKSNGHYFDIGTDNECKDMSIYPRAVVGVLHDQESDARLIVTAVNYHHRLREALESLIVAAENIEGEHVIGRGDLDNKAESARALLDELDNMEQAK